MKRNVLIINDNLQDIYKIISLYPNQKFNLYIFTDDLAIHKKFFHTQSSVIKSYFKDSAISYYQIKEIEKSAIDFINYQIGSLKLEIPNYVYSIDLHVEGAGISRKIREKCLLFDNLSYIIDCNSIDEIVVSRSICISTDFKIYNFIADIKNLNVRVYNQSNKLIINILNIYKRCIESLFYNFYSFIYFLYFIYRSISFLFDNKNLNNYLLKNKKNIVITNQNNFDHHFKNRLGLVNFFRNQQEFPFLVVGVSMKNTISKYRKIGIRAFNLASSCNFKDILYSIKIWLQNYPRINQKLYQESRDNNFNSLLLSILFSDISKFYKTSFLTRIYLWNSSRRFTNKSNILAMRIMLNFNSFVGNLLYTESFNQNIRPVYFRNDTGFKWGYESFGEYSKYYDLQFTLGEIDKKWYESRVHNHCKVIVSGSNKLKFDFLAYQKAIDSKKELKSILFLTNGNEPGTYSKDECFQSILLFKEITSKYPNLIIKIKPHPIEDVSFLNKIIDSSSSTNLVLLDRSTNLRDQINLTDLVISRNTSATLEAMVLHKPVVSLSIDRDSHVYDNLVNKSFAVRTIKELRDIILSLYLENIFNDWSSDQLIKQLHFINKQIYNSSLDPDNYIFSEILSCLKERYKD